MNILLMKLFPLRACDQLYLTKNIKIVNYTQLHALSHTHTHWRAAILHAEDIIRL